MSNGDNSRSNMARRYSLEPLQPPAQLRQMIGLAEVLGRDFDFARIDLYLIDGKIFFGEVTHYPNAGLVEFRPREFDRVLGDVWRKGTPIPSKYYVPRSDARADPRGLPVTGSANSGQLRRSPRTWPARRSCPDFRAAPAAQGSSSQWQRFDLEIGRVGAQREDLGSKAVLEMSFTGGHRPIEPPNSRTPTSERFTARARKRTRPLWSRGDAPVQILRAKRYHVLRLHYGRSRRRFTPILGLGPLGKPWRPARRPGDAVCASYRASSRRPRARRGW